MGLFSIFSRRPSVDSVDNVAKPATTEWPEVDLAPLLDWFAQHQRPAGRPVVGEAADVLTQFGGAPLLAPGEAMPTCAHCGRELQLIVQVDLAHLPAESAGAFGPGLLQLFYCIGGNETPEHPDCWGEDGWEAFTDTASRVRVLPATDGLVRGSAREDFPALPVVAWDRFDDAPDWDEWPSQGLSVRRGGEIGFAASELTWVSAGEQTTLTVPNQQCDRLPSPATGDKLGGWPYWVQSVEYPACPRCNSEMRLVLQIDSDDHVPYTWGDCGCGHITQCPQHLDVVAFGWACT